MSTEKHAKEYTYTNQFGKVPASVVAHNDDGTFDIHAAEDDSKQVVLIENVALGEGGGYLQEKGS